MRATGGRAEPRTGSPSGGPLNLIHTTKPSNPSPATVSSRFDFVGGVALGDLVETASVPGRTPFQALHLLRLHREFGVDITGSAGLGGAVLDEWIRRAEDSLTQSLFEDYRQHRQGVPSAKT